MSGPSFVALDFECANGSHASVCAIGVVRVVDGVMGQPRHWFVRPKAPYDFLAGMNRRITGIEPHQLRHAAGFDYYGPLLARNIADAVIVGHNVKADMSMFEQSWHSHRLGRFPNFRYLDTLPLAQRLRPGLDRYKLNHLVTEVLGEDMAGHHQADNDAVAAARIATTLLTESGLDIDELASLRLGKRYMDLKPPPTRAAWSYSI